MTAHRFRDQFRFAQPVPALAGVPAAFVPCPMFASMPAFQQSQIQEVYRIAAELTREQLKPTVDYPQFSMN